MTPLSMHVSNMGWITDDAPLGPIPPPDSKDPSSAQVSGSIQMFTEKLSQNRRMVLTVPGLRFTIAPGTDLSLIYEGICPNDRVRLRNEGEFGFCSMCLALFKAEADTVTVRLQNF